MKNNTHYSDGIIKAIALMDYHNEPYFIEHVNNKVYTGNVIDTQASFEADKDTKLTFADWCLENCTEVEEYDNDSYDNDYICLTDDEATEKAEEYIKDSLWAFTPSFLSYQTDLPEEVFTAIQDNGKCESNNDAIAQIINKCADMGTFIEAAIQADGRGHFMSSYDGNETEATVTIDSETFTFYIYRMN